MGRQEVWRGVERGGYLDAGVKLASSAVPEGVGMQLPVQAGHDRVAGGAVSMVKAVVGIQRRGAGGEVPRRAWLVLRHIPCMPTALVPLCSTTAYRENETTKAHWRAMRIVGSSLHQAFKDTTGGGASPAAS